MTVLSSPPKLYILSPQIGEKHFFFFGCSFVSFFIMVMVRMAMGWDRTKGWGLYPLSYPIPTLPRIMGKIFLPHASLSPRALWSPAPPRKTLLFVNFSHNYNIYIYILMKPISLIKIYLKLQLNLSHKIKLIFSKNWIQVFNKTILQQKEKSHSITHNKIIQTPNTWKNKNCLLLQQ